MHGHIRAVFPGKSEQPYYGFTHLLPPTIPLPLCAVFSFFHTTGCGAYSFTADGYGIFNVRTKCGYAMYTRKGARHKVCTRVDSGGTEKLFVTLPRQRFKPRVFGFEFRRCNH